MFTCLFFPFFIQGWNFVSVFLTGMISSRNEISSRQKRVNSKRHFTIDRNNFIPGRVSSWDEVSSINTLLHVLLWTAEETSAWVFYFEFSTNFKNTFFIEHLLWQYFLEKQSTGVVLLKSCPGKLFSLNQEQRKHSTSLILLGATLNSNWDIRWWITLCL